MSSDEEIADLERLLQHARDIALTSIGQSDRAENVAYRDKLAEMLRRPRAERPSGLR